MSKKKKNLTINDIFFRKPHPTDGPAVYELIKDCDPLDVNSRYCNLLQTYHFKDTCVAAECPDGKLWGFISGYVIPDSDNTLFIWQVAVSQQARGLGLGKEMIYHILGRRYLDIHYIHTTITEENGASWGMFSSLARDLDANMSTRLLFDSEKHFDGRHEDEIMLQLGPFRLEKGK
jgi:L-2,4-diaminobutyric acid acetyltransferase